MYKVSVSVPAVCTHLGPGYQVLGLALNLRNTVEMSLSSDDRLTVEVRGEGRDALPTDVYNPAVRAAIKVFQRLEQAPAGLHVRCLNEVPFGAGLAAHTTLAIGGLVGANNLLGSPFSHDDLIEMAAALSGECAACVTAMRGGLGICSRDGDSILYRAIEITPLRVVVALPALPGGTLGRAAALPASVSLADAVHHIGRTALLIEALREGDVRLLRRVMDDRLREPACRETIPGYAAVIAAARDAGALAVTLCGEGPALLAFAAYNHAAVEHAMRAAFAGAGVEARTWSLSSDLQGVVISVVE
jgi:homoserine kinase